MKTATVNSAVTRGTQAVPVAVEVGIGRGLPAFRIIGMADADAQESRLRMRAALRASGFSVPDGTVTVSLAPGVLRKAGASLDLPIAVGILAVLQALQQPVSAGVVRIVRAGSAYEMSASFQLVCSARRARATTSATLPTTAPAAQGKFVHGSRR